MNRRLDRILAALPHVAVALCWALAACESREPPPTPAPSSTTLSQTPAQGVDAAERARVIELATAAIAPFRKELAGALASALQQGGPLRAIDVCATTAQQLAAKASSAQIEVGRSALRLRNPSNAPREWLKPILAEMVQLESPSGAQRVTSLANARYGYAEAIVLQPQCVVCHGSVLAPELAAAIKARYPQDQATGFEPGQLRGVFWAEVALQDSGARAKDADDRAR